MKTDIRSFFKKEYYTGNKRVSDIKFTFRELVDFAHEYHNHTKKYDTKIDVLNCRTELHIIHKAICIYFNCDLKFPFSRSRKKEVITTRQWFFYMSRVLNPEYIVTLSDIGKYYSGVTRNRPFDHANVLHHINTINAEVTIYSDSYKIKNDLENLIIDLKEDEMRKLKLENI